MFNDNLDHYGIKGNNGCVWDTLYNPSRLRQHYIYFRVVIYQK